MPVAAKNFQVTGRFSFVPGTSGLNLYIGNNPEFEAAALRPGAEWEKVVALPLREGFKSPAEKQRFYYSKTTQYLREQPGSFVKGLLRKSKEFTSTREMPGHVDVYMFNKWSPLLGVLVWEAGGFGFPFGVLLPLALLGIFVGWRKVPVPVWLFLVFYSASVILTHVEARYKIPVVIAMCPLAGAGLVKIAGLIRLKRWFSLAAAVVFCAGVAGLFSIAGPFYSERHVDYEAELHYVLASSLQYRGRIAEAAESYNKAITLRPDYVEAYQNLGLLLTGQGELDEAVSHYDRALAMFPNHAGLHEGLGIAFLQLGRIGDAIEYYRKAIRIDPWRASAYDNLGTAFFKLNRLPEAMENYSKAVELNPEDPVAHTNFGCLLAAQGQFDEAIEHFETSLRIRPNQAQTLSNLASAFASLGEFDKATKKFRDALRLAPDDAETWFNLGLCLEEQERTDEAVHAYRKALAINPGHQRARHALQKLGRAKP
jgi:Flp pilus assembly protein TadD